MLIFVVNFEQNAHNLVMKLMKCNQGSASLLIVSILLTAGALGLATTDIFQSSTNMIYKNQLRESLVKMSDLARLSLMNEVACTAFLTENNLLNHNWNALNNKEFDLKFYNYAGLSDGVLRDKVLVGFENKYTPIFKINKMQAWSDRTIVAYLSPFYSSAGSLKFNTTEFDLPIYLEIDLANNVINCRATMKSPFDNSITLEDYVCKLLNGGAAVKYSIGNRTCV